jgi:hypothetical protein
MKTSIIYVCGAGLKKKKKKNLYGRLLSITYIASKTIDIYYISPHLPRHINNKFLITYYIFNFTNFFYIF